MVAALAAVAALVAGCSPGSTPALPVEPAPSSSAAPSPTPTPARAGLRRQGPQHEGRRRTRPERPAAVERLGRTRRSPRSRPRESSTVGVSADNLLFGFRNPITGQLEGFDIDMVNEVAHAIFGDNIKGKIEYRVENFAQRIPGSARRSGRSRRRHHDDQLRALEPDRVLHRVLPGRPAGARPQGLAVPGRQRAERRKVCTANGSTGEREPRQPVPQGRAGTRREHQRLHGPVPARHGRRSRLRQHRGGRVRQPGPVRADRRPSRSPTSRTGSASRRRTSTSFSSSMHCSDTMRADGRWAAIYHKWLPGKVPAPPAAVYGRDLP